MRRVLAAAVLVAFMPTANAQDKAKGDFSTDAEYRARYFLMQNPTANETDVSSAGQGEHRFRFGANYKASEKLSAGLTLIHNAQWGQMNGVTARPTAEHDNATGGLEENFMAVNEAYMKWMVSDDLSFKVGRQGYSFADGYVMGRNDWESTPYSYEGLLVNWEAEFGKFNFFGFKHKDEAVATGNSASADPEHNSYGIVFDLKSKPEWMKALSVHVIKDNADARFGATQTNNNGNQGKDYLRYGLMAGFGFGDFDLTAWYAAHSGKSKLIAAGGAKTERDHEGNLIQAQLGYTAQNFMQSRFFFTYHMDSGDDNTGDANDKGYDSYYTEKHNSAGMMDLFGWGNLTFMQLGWTMKPQDKTEVGLQYTMFSRTEASATSQTFVAGKYGAGLGGAGNTKDKLGDEIDLWATHSYTDSLATTFRVGYFMPGDHFTDATTNNDEDKILHIMIEGKATF